MIPMVETVPALSLEPTAMVALGSQRDRTAVRGVDRFVDRVAWEDRETGGSARAARGVLPGRVAGAMEQGYLNPRVRGSSP